MTVSVSNVNLMERVRHCTNKMLCITRHIGMTYITMHGLDRVQVSTWSPQYRIVLSRDLLYWISEKGRIPCSFTNFITTPDLSGPFYISQGICHTQIIKYILERIYQWALFNLNSDDSWETYMEVEESGESLCWYKYRNLEQYHRESLQWRFWE